MILVLEVGTCGLRTVHGALKHGGKATGTLIRFSLLFLRSLIKALLGELIMRDYLASLLYTLYSFVHTDGLKTRL